MSDEFEVVKSTRNLPAVGNNESQNTKLQDAFADNFGNIIGLAKDIVEVGKIKVQSEAVLARMTEDRKMLLAEAEAYAIKINADTRNIVERMRVIQDLLRDFYIYNQSTPSGLSGEDFSRIITELLDKTR